MKTRNRILVPTISITVLSVIVLYFAVSRLFREESERSLEEAVNAKSGEIQSYIHLVEQKCLSHAALFSRAAVVQQAYAISYQGKITDEQDGKAEEARKLLREHFSPLAKAYTETTGEATYGLHFHLPPARSLLRVWQNSQKTSDDLSQFRKTILDVNQGVRKQIAGIEVGVGGFAIRGIVPVRGDKDQQLGSVEMLSEYEPIVISAKRSQNENLAVYMNTTLLHIATKLSDTKKNPRVGERYVLVTATEPVLAGRVLDASLLEAGSRELTVEKRDHYQVATWPIKDYSGQQVGVLAYMLDCSEQLAHASALRRSIATIAILLVASLTFTAILISRSIIRPLSAAVEFARRFGEGDLAARLSVGKRRDEFSAMASCLNNTAERLQSALGNVIGVASQLNDSSTTLSSAATQMSGNADVTQKETASVAGAAQHMSSNMKEMAASAEQMSANVRTVASAVEQITASISNVARSAEEAADVAKNAAQLAETSSSNISQLDAAADMIGKVIETIQDIAEQTNLLALNATIEAARAGDAGKGFAVVANEVKELARQTADATQDIRQRIEAIQGSTCQTVKAIGEIGEVVRRINETSRTIASSVEEQSLTTREIARNVAETAVAAETVTGSIRETAAAVEEITLNITRVDSNARETAQQAGQTQTASQQLTALSNNLRISVSQFKLRQNSENAA